jgi:hypothetical protein
VRDARFPRDRSLESDAAPPEESRAAGVGEIRALVKPVRSGGGAVAVGCESLQEPVPATGIGEEVKTPTELVAMAYGEAAAPGLAGVARSSASLGGNREKDAGGIE